MINDDFCFRNSDISEATPLQGPERGVFRGANTCEYLKFSIWYSHYLVFAKYCEYQIASLNKPKGRKGIFFLLVTYQMQTTRI